MGLSSTTAKYHLRPFYPSLCKLPVPCPCFFAYVGRTSSSGNFSFIYKRNYYLSTAHTKTIKPDTGPWIQATSDLRSLRKGCSSLGSEHSVIKDSDFIHLNNWDAEGKSSDDISSFSSDCNLRGHGLLVEHKPNQEKLLDECYHTCGSSTLFKEEPTTAELKWINKNKKLTYSRKKEDYDAVGGKEKVKKEFSGEFHDQGVHSLVLNAHKTGRAGRIVASNILNGKVSTAYGSVLSSVECDEYSNDLAFGGEIDGVPCQVVCSDVMNAMKTKDLDMPLDTLQSPSTKKLSSKLSSVYESVLIVDNLTTANQIVSKLVTEYQDLVHSCDTEVANIDVKQETPVGHGEIICFSIYSGPQADYGNGKSCIWVDVLDGGGKDMLIAFQPFFESQSIKKVWHNYSFDNHVIENYGIRVRGFHADTMHMARLWDSSRRLDGGYSLEALTRDSRVMNAASSQFEHLIGKVSMKTIFGKKKIKVDGSEGKTVTISPVEELQKNERMLWICYSSLDAISTLQLYHSLAQKLSEMKWILDGHQLLDKSMFDFYQEYWCPFGKLLVQMEMEGMLVDRSYLSEIEKIARSDQKVAVNKFRTWASKYCADAKYMNMGSDTQLRQLLFGGISNRKDPSVTLPDKKTFKVPNMDNVIEEGKKKPSKLRNIELHQIGVDLPTDMFTTSGWPSVGGDALKALAGKVSSDYYVVDDASDVDMEISGVGIERRRMSFFEGIDTSTYGNALYAFRDREEGIEACHAIASLCDVSSIDSLISNFILPLQGTNISGKEGRVHCSLNINTETGRLSARRPNLQNQPALEKDRYKIRQAFVASPGNSLIVADYGQLELRILAHLANCKSMLDAFKAGGDFHSRTAMNMYPYIRDAINKNEVLLEWHGEEKPPVPLLKDAFASERRKAKMLNFSIAYGKTPVGLARDWKVSVEEAKETVARWYSDRKEVLEWQEARKQEARSQGYVLTLLGRARNFPSLKNLTRSHKNHIERAAINTPVQGSAADVAMCAMLEISKNLCLRELGWKLLLQIHDEVILEGPSESAEVARNIVVDCMSKPFGGRNFLRVGLSVDAKCAQNWYSAK